MIVFFHGGLFYHSKSNAIFLPTQLVDLSYFMNDICYLYVYGQWDAHPYCYVTITTICVLHKIAFSFNIRTKLIFKSEQIYHICIP